MEKTTVYLTTTQKAALARLAAAEGRTEARLIREGIDAVTAGHRVGEPPARMAFGELEPGDAAPTLARPRWIDRAAFMDLLGAAQADPGLRADLDDLSPGTTDDEPIA